MMSSYTKKIYTTSQINKLSWSKIAKKGTDDTLVEFQKLIKFFDKRTEVSRDSFLPIEKDINANR